jgi:hypothetical protein
MCVSEENLACVLRVSEYLHVDIQAFWGVRYFFLLAETNHPPNLVVRVIPFQSMSCFSILLEKTDCFLKFLFIPSNGSRGHLR